MGTQSYYLTELEQDADVCDISLPLLVNCAGIVDEKSPFSLHYVRNDYYFLYLTQGALHTHLGTLRSGDLVIFEPRRVYSYVSEAETSYLWVHFTGNAVLSLLRENGLPTSAITNIGVQQIIKDRFENLFYEFVINDRQSEQMKISLLKEIIILSGRYKNGASFRKAPFRSVAYINKNYASDIPIGHLADLENMSLTKFRTVFREQTGSSPLEYITLKRISAACRMLTQTQSSIGDISAAVGYDDPYYFSRIFKKKMGMSPKKYQKNTRIE